MFQLFRQDSHSSSSLFITAFLTLSGQARLELQERVERLATERPPVPQRVWRKPQWLKPEVRVRVKHLQGRDTLRHANVQGLVTWNSTASSQLA
jgi:hypothetical protein